eukprot:IDg3806t1
MSLRCLKNLKEGSVEADALPANTSSITQSWNVRVCDTAMAATQKVEQRQRCKKFTGLQKWTEKISKRQKKLSLTLRKSIAKAMRANRVMSEATVSI